MRKPGGIIVENAGVVLPQPEVVRPLKAMESLMKTPKDDNKDRKRRSLNTSAMAVIRKYHKRCRQPENPAIYAPLEEFLRGIKEGRIKTVFEGIVGSNLVYRIETVKKNGTILKQNENK